MRATEFISKSIDITQHVTGHHHGQTDVRLEARTDRGLSGYLDYSVLHGQPQITMIHVAHRREGVGSALVKHLQSLYPTTEIDWGSLTPKGSQLYKSIEFEEIPNPRVIRDMRKLEQLKQKEAGYRALADEWERSSKSEEDRRRFLDDTSDWNDLHSEIMDLEQELHDQKPYRRLVKI